MPSLHVHASNYCFQIVLFCKKAHARTVHDRFLIKMINDSLSEILQSPAVHPWLCLRKSQKYESKGKKVSLIILWKMKLVNIFASTFGDISQWHRGRLGGLRILAALLKPFGAGPY